MLHKGNTFLVTFDLYGDGGDVGLYAFNGDQLNIDRVIELMAEYQAQLLQEEKDKNGNWITVECDEPFHMWVEGKGYDCEYQNHYHIKPNGEGASEFISKEHSPLSRLFEMQV